MGIEITIKCNECERTIQLDDAIYCFECIEKLKEEIQTRIDIAKENKWDRESKE